MSRSTWLSAGSTSVCDCPAVGTQVRTCFRPEPASAAIPSKPSWHLDEAGVVIWGKRLWLWQPVNTEGEILNVFVQPRRDRTAALQLMHKLLSKQGCAPDVLVTDRLASYLSAGRELCMRARRKQGLRKTNGA